MAETKNIMIVGVGGQGTLLTSRILGGITVENGYDVSKKYYDRRCRWTGNPSHEQNPRRSDDRRWL